MANTIQIKRKTTTGAPSAGSLAVGEMCWVDPDNAMYIKKIDNSVTQLNSSGGSSISFFQVQDDGGSGQLTTGTNTDLAGIWDTPTLDNADFSWDGATGILTVNADGTLEVDTKAVSWNNANNRHELHLQLMYNDGGGFVVMTEDAQYASRNNTQNKGGAYIHGFKIAVSSGDQIKVRVSDIGVAATIGDSNTAGHTYISAKLFK